MDNYKKVQIELTTRENYYRTIIKNIIPALGALTLKELKPTISKAITE